MSQDAPTLGDVLQAAIDGAVGNVRTGLPGVIKSYDADKRRATCQVLVPDAVYDEKDARTTETITLTDVPVLALGAGTVRVKVPIKPGCPCWLMFSSSCIARLKATGRMEVQDAGDDRRHHEADVVAMPIPTLAAAAADDDAVIEFTDDGLIKAGGDEPLLTRAEFLRHGHATAGTGTPSPPIDVSPATGLPADFPGTPRLRG